MTNLYIVIIKHSRLKEIESHQARWYKIYDQVLEYVNKREELRKTYDHYEAKMEEMIKDLDDNNYMNKLEQKFRNSMEEYADYSRFTYRQIQSLLDYRYNYVNVCLTEFVEAFTDYYGDCHRVCKDFIDIDERFALKDSMTEERADLFSQYNPYIFMKGSKILDEFNKAKNYNQAINMINESPNIIVENPIIDPSKDENRQVTTNDTLIVQQCDNYTNISKEEIKRT
jgi:hypothetical protein